MAYVILDLETIPDPALPVRHTPDLDDALYALLRRASRLFGGRMKIRPPSRIAAPPHHQIVCAGALLMRDDYSISGMRADTDERTALTKIVETLSARAVNLVTFAGRRFDLPVVIARCYHHGISFPRYYQAGRGIEYRYRYVHEPHLDLMDLFSDFGAAPSANMDAMAKLAGWPGKQGVDGTDVARLVKDGKLEEVVRYNLSDLVQTAAVFLRAQLLRGLLTTSHYRVSMTRLLDFCEADPRLAPVAAAADRSRALLVEDGASS
jgi:3'-5' exonuclease